MYRVVSILLAMVSVAIVFFGLSLCNDGINRCEQLRAASAQTQTVDPVNVQRIMVMAGILAFVGGVIGFLRGPTTLPPWYTERGEGHLMTPQDIVHAPFLVRGAAFLGGLIALAGILAPVMMLVPPAPGLGAPVVVTIVVSVLLIAYFAWHLWER